MEKYRQTTNIFSLNAEYVNEEIVKMLLVFFGIDEADFATMRELKIEWRTDSYLRAEVTFVDDLIDAPIVSKQHDPGDRGRESVE